MNGCVRIVQVNRGKRVWRTYEQNGQVRKYNSSGVYFPVLCCDDIPGSSRDDGGGMR